MGGALAVLTQADGAGAGDVATTKNEYSSIGLSDLFARSFYRSFFVYSNFITVGQCSLGIIYT